MIDFIQAAAAAVITAVLCLVLEKQNKDYAVVLGIGMCCMILILTVKLLRPVFDFFQKLQGLGQLDPEFLSILLKSVGIGILAEITTMLCTDAGKAALGKGIHVLACATILYISLPLFSGLLDLITEILGGT